jgi:hypothetical protein
MSYPHALPTGLRATEAYLTMSTYRAVEIVEDTPSDVAEEQYLAAWQYLHDTGIGYSLQGWYGRSLSSLLAEGRIGQ